MPATKQEQLLEDIREIVCDETSHHVEAGVIHLKEHMGQTMPDPCSGCGFDEDGIVEAIKKDLRIMNGNLSLICNKLDSLIEMLRQQR